MLLVWFPWDRLEGEDYMYTGGCGNVQACARIVLFFIVLISVGSCIGSGLLLGTKWAGNGKDHYTWFGVAQLIGTILVFVSLSNVLSLSLSLTHNLFVLVCLHWHMVFVLVYFLFVYFFFVSGIIWRFGRNMSEDAAF